MSQRWNNIFWICEAAAVGMYNNIYGTGDVGLKLDSLCTADKNARTYGCRSRSETWGKPFLHASVVSMDSSTDPAQQGQGTTFLTSQSAK